MKDDLGGREAVDEEHDVTLVDHLVTDRLSALTTERYGSCPIARV
jgi:hypothetical protein